jgi:hypothetical protein
VAAAIVATGTFALTNAARHDEDHVVPVAPSTSVPGSTTVVGAPSNDLIVIGAVSQWIRNLADGAGARAWELVGPQSRASVDQGAFDSMVPDLAATWRPYVGGNAGFTAYPLDRDLTLWVVRVQLADGTGPQAIGAGVRGSTAYVEPFLPGTALSLVSFPLDGSSTGAPKVAAGASIQVHVDVDSKGSVVAVDGQTLSASEMTKDADGNVTSVRPHSLRPGTHDILVAEVTRGGTLALVDQAFTVTG